MSINKTLVLAALPNTARAQTTHLSYDKKSDRIAYASGKSIFIRSVANPEKSVQFVNHNFNTTVARFAPSGFYIASGDESGNVKIWDTVNEEELIVKGEYQIINGRINDIAWDADSKRIIAVGNGKEKFGHAFTWDSGNTVGDISGHSAQINAVAIRPVRPYRAATVSDDSALVFFQGPPFRFDSSIRGHHTNFIKDVKYSPNGEHLVSVGSDRSIVVYDGKTGEFVKKIGAGEHQGGIFALSFVDDEQFVTASGDSTVKLWNITSGEVIKTWTFEKSVETQQLGIVSTDKYIISLSYNGDLNYLSLDSETPVKIIKGHQKSITSSTLTEKNLFTGSYDGRIVKWDLKTFESDYESGNSSYIVGLTQEEGEIVSTSWDDTLKSSAYNVSIPSQPKGISSNKSSVFVLTEGSIISYSKGKENFKVDLSGTGTAIGSSSKHIAVGLQSNAVIIYDSATGSKEFEITSNRAPPSFIKFSPNEELVAIGDNNGKIVLYDVINKKLVTSRWAFHTSRVTSLSWNEDNDHVVSGSLDTNLIVYSVKTPGKNIKYLNAHKEGVTTVQWLNETEFITGGNDSAVKKWEVKFT